MEEILSKSTYGVRRAGLASLATMSLVTAAAVAGAGAASATTDFKFQRIGGADRYETSTLVADEFATANPDVILANGEPGNYADALSANTLAGEKNIPVLLTRKDKTPASVLAQLKEDGTKNITVVGGTSVVSDAQVAALKAAGYTVTRVAGADRFATNADIIGASGAAAGDTGLIATGFNFPDALAAGPVSFQGHPLGLSTKDSIDDEVVAALKAAGVTKVLDLRWRRPPCRPAVVAKLAANGIDTSPQRFAGTDRADTSAQAAEYAVKNLSFTNTHVGVASGYVKGFGADALAGGPLEGKEKSPMLVTRDVNVPGASVLAYLKDHAATLKDRSPLRWHGRYLGRCSGRDGEGCSDRSRLGRRAVPSCQCRDWRHGAPVRPADQPGGHDGDLHLRRGCRDRSAPGAANFYVYNYSATALRPRRRTPRFPPSGNTSPFGSTTSTAAAEAAALTRRDGRRRRRDRPARSDRPRGRRCARYHGRRHDSPCRLASPRRPTCFGRQLPSGLHGRHDRGRLHLRRGCHRCRPRSGFMLVLLNGTDG